MSKIKYSADDFPALKNTTDTHTTATETQAGQTEVSAITESAIHSAVKTAFAKLQADHKVMEEQWKLKFDNLEKQMQELSQSVASDVIAAMLKSDDMPFLDKTSFFKQMNHQTTTMTAIMETSNMQVTDIKRMFMTIESRLRDGPTTVSSPPRKLRSMVANRATEPTDSPNSNLSNPPPSMEAGMNQ
jgi:excinuclease UvrABC ATPase subunit